MRLALSTRWNAYRHENGAHLGDEILELGFSRIELGYDTHPALVPGIESLIRNQSLTCGSVHNYCPIPAGHPHGHPEGYSLSSTDPAERRLAVQHTEATIEFAARMGADVVVAHAGRVRMRPLTPEWIDLHTTGRQSSPRGQRLKNRMIRRRLRQAPAHLDALMRSLDALIPALEGNPIRLALENLPFWESIPTTDEMRNLLEHYAGAPIAYWHDLGHGRIRQNLDLEPQLFSLRALEHGLAGLHIHDVRAPAFDHVMPPLGDLPFSHFQAVSAQARHLVIEPSPGTPACHIMDAVSFLNRIWSLT